MPDISAKKPITPPRTSTSTICSLLNHHQLLDYKTSFQLPLGPWLQEQLLTPYSRQPRRLRHQHAHHQQLRYHTAPFHETIFQHRKKKNTWSSMSSVVTFPKKASRESIADRMSTVASSRLAPALQMFLAFI